MIDDADAIQDLSSATTAPTTPTRTERDDEETDAATETQTLAPPKPKTKKPRTKKPKAKKPRAVEGGVRKAKPKPKHRKVDELEGASLVSLASMRRALRKIHRGPMQAGFFLFATAVSDSLLESMMADLQTICARTQAPMVKRTHVAELLSMFPYSTLFSDVRLMDNLADLAKKGPSPAGGVLFARSFGSAVLPHIKRKRRPRVASAEPAAQVAN